MYLIDYGDIVEFNAVAIVFTRKASSIHQHLNNIEIIPK